MKAVILAAGKGTRMGDLSKETPKPMLKVLGKTLIEHKLLSLPESVTEVVIVVGYLKDKIVDVLGSEYAGKKIVYVVQEELNGTAGALFCARDILQGEEKFLVLMGDDIYSKEDMEECIKHDYAILIRETDNLQGRAKVVFDGEGHIKDILEKYPDPVSGFVCTGMYTITPKIFEYTQVGIPGGELGLPQTILSMKDEVKIKAVQSRFWLNITSPEDLIIAETFLKID